MPIINDFPGKQADEEVKLVLRRHPFLLIRQNLIYILYFIVPPILYVLGKSYFTFILSFPIYPLFILITSLYYSFFLFFLLIEWIDYYFDAWIITNKRLIDVEQIGLFKRSVSETRLEKIQDVTFEVKGVFATIFHYGSINVQTAGATQNFKIDQISDPANIKTLLLALYDERIKTTGITNDARQESSTKTTKSSSSTSSSSIDPNSNPSSDIKIIRDIK